MKKVDINDMSYVELIALIKEENRPPGGKKTVREIIQNSFINSQSCVLEVGCTNGFTSLELARIIKCKVYGIDIEEAEIVNAKERVKGENVTFLKASAYSIPFQDNFFDLVICNNATSFMDNKSKAIDEYIRVTKAWGFIAISPMHYIRTPPKNIVAQISNIIGTSVGVMGKNDWMKLIQRQNLEIYYSRDYKFEKKTKAQIKEYVKEILNKPHLKKFSNEDREILYKRWTEIMSIFGQNLEYVGYSIMLLRKRTEPEEIELFDVKNI